MLSSNKISQLEHAYSLLMFMEMYTDCS